MKIIREIDILVKLESIQYDLSWAVKEYDKKDRINNFKKAKIKLDELIKLMKQPELK